MLRPSGPARRPSAALRFFQDAARGAPTSVGWRAATVACASFFARSYGACSAVILRLGQFGTTVRKEASPPRVKRGGQDRSRICFGLAQKRRHGLAQIVSHFFLLHFAPFQHRQPV